MPEKYRNRRVKLIDTTLREGLQTPELHDRAAEGKLGGRIYLTSDHKLALFDSIARLGLSHFEVFAPSVNRSELNDLPAILEMRASLSEELKRPISVFAHTRLDEGDITKAIKTGVSGLDIFIRSSDVSRGAPEPLTKDKIIKMAYPLLYQIRRDYPQLNIRFSLEDTFRTNIKDIITISEAVVDFIDRLGIPDTVGKATPSTVRSVILKLIKRFPNVPLNVHFHNDRQLAIANSLAAIKAGAEFVDVSTLGLGERSGITSTTTFLLNLLEEGDPSIVDYDLKRSYSLNILLASIMGIQVPSYESVSLSNITHSAGVHAAGILKKHRSFYEAHALDKFGVTGDSLLLLGPLSGWHVVKYFLNQILEYEGATEQVIKEITQVFKDRSVEIQKGEKKPIDLLEEIALEKGLKKRSGHEDDIREL